MRPFVRYWLQISARRSHATMLCHSVRSWRSPDPLSFHTSSVASENRQNGVPLAVYLSSGSRPSRPTRITLLTDFAIEAPQKMGCLSIVGTSVPVQVHVKSDRLLAGRPPRWLLKLLELALRINGFTRI